MIGSKPEPAAWADRWRGNLHKRDLSSRDVISYVCRLSSFFPYFFFSNRMSPAVVSQSSLDLRVSSVANFLHQNLVYLSGFFFFTKYDKIYKVMHTTERETPHETFKHRFDASFGEDCRNCGRRLHYIRKGKHGNGSCPPIHLSN